MLTGVTLFDCAMHRLIHNSFENIYSQQRGGSGGDFDFLAAGPWYDPVLTTHLPSWGMVTNEWCA